MTWAEALPDTHRTIAIATLACPIALESAPERWPGVATLGDLADLPDEEVEAGWEPEHVDSVRAYIREIGRLPISVLRRLAFERPNPFAPRHTRLPRVDFPILRALVEAETLEDEVRALVADRSEDRAEAFLDHLRRASDEPLAPEEFGDERARDRWETAMWVEDRVRHLASTGLVLPIGRRTVTKLHAGGALTTPAFARKLGSAAPPSHILLVLPALSRAGLVPGIAHDPETDLWRARGGPGGGEKVFWVPPAARSAPSCGLALPARVRGAIERHGYYYYPTVGDFHRRPEREVADIDGVGIWAYRQLVAALECAGVRRVTRAEAADREAEELLVGPGVDILPENIDQVRQAEDERPESWIAEPSPIASIGNAPGSPRPRLGRRPRLHDRPRKLAPEEAAFWLPAGARALPFDALPLPARVRALLRRRCPDTVGYLHEITEAEFLLIDGMGPSSLRDIRTALLSVGGRRTTLEEVRALRDEREPGRVPAEDGEAAEDRGTGDSDRRPAAAVDVPVTHRPIGIAYIDWPVGPGPVLDRWWDVRTLGDLADLPAADVDRCWEPERGRRVRAHIACIAGLPIEGLRRLALDRLDDDDDVLRIPLVRFPILAALARAITLEDELRAIVADLPEDRASAFLARLPRGGAGRPTLAELAGRIGVSRDRVRQVVRDRFRYLEGRAIRLPIASRVVRVLTDAGAPLDTESYVDRLREEGLPQRPETLRALPELSDRMLVPEIEYDERADRWRIPAAEEAGTDAVRSRANPARPRRTRSGRGR